MTALVVLRRCPRKFAFAEIEGHGRLAPEGAALGAAVHRAIQGSAPTTSETRPYVDAFLRSAYANRRLVASELPVRMRRGGFTVNGRIDAVFADGDGGWEIVDFKTGSAPAIPEEADDAQLEAYALAAIGEYGRDPARIRTTYLYLATGETRSRAWSEELASLARARLDGDLSHITACDYPALPNRTCGACEALPVCPAGLAHVAANI